MYQPKFYKIIDRKKIEEGVRKDGFNPIYISDPPNFSYKEHAHPEVKLLLFLEGEMKITIDGESFLCSPGDRIIIPGDTSHSAVTGKDGCSFFWAEKLS